MSGLSSAVAEASLINDVEFLEELERLEYVTPPSQPAPSRPPLKPITYDDAFDALEACLPVSSSPKVAGVPYFKRAPIPELELPFVAEPERVHTSSFDDEDEDEPEPVESAISFRTAAIVILFCLSVGAATATVVFSKQVSRISALVTARR